MRKGQKLINFVSIALRNAGFQPTNDNIENEIWNMSDEEFDKIINKDG